MYSAANNGIIVSCWNSRLPLLIALVTPSSDWDFYSSLCYAFRLYLGQLLCILEQKNKCSFLCSGAFDCYSLVESHVFLYSFSNELNCPRNSSVFLESFLRVSELFRIILLWSLTNALGESSWWINEQRSRQKWEELRWQHERRWGS